MRGVRLSDGFVRGAIDALQAAVNASVGDSNDEEIEALQECAEMLAQVLGIDMPEPELEEEL